MRKTIREIVDTAGEELNFISTSKIVAMNFNKSTFKGLFKGDKMDILQKMASLRLIKNQEVAHAGRRWLYKRKANLSMNTSEPVNLTLIERSYL